MGKKYFCIRRKPKRKRLIFSISKKTSISSPQEFISFYTEEENFLLINKYGKEIINNQFSSDYQIDHNYLYRIKISNELRRISLKWIYSIVIENNFDLDDMLNMKRFYSMNLIKTSDGYSSFITKLPGKIGK